MEPVVYGLTELVALISQLGLAEPRELIKSRCRWGPFPCSLGLGCPDYSFGPWALIVVHHST